MRPSSSLSYIRLQSDLPDLAAALGIEPEFWNLWGERVVTPPETARALCVALGVDPSDPAALEQRAARRYGRTLEPVTVTRAAAVVQLYVRADWPAGDAVAWTLALEDGGRRSGQAALGELAETAQDGGFRTFTLPLGEQPLGYHQLEVRLTHGAARQALIVAPDRAWQAAGGRRAGLAVSLYGVRSARNWGAGDFTDLAALAGWIRRGLGADFVALNPLHAIHNRAPYNTSPYLPNSSYYRNSLYLDVEAIADFQASPGARRLCASAAFQERLAALRAAEFVDYEGVSRVKQLALLLAYRQFRRAELAHDTARAGAFRAWAAAEGEPLDRFAAYCALDRRLHRRDPRLWIWPDWPPEYREPDSPAVAAFAAAHAAELDFHRWVQWQIDQQLAAAQQAALDAGMAIGLYHDLALATDRCGSDLWAYRDAFVNGCRVGSPPDSFAPEGQDWSFPPPNIDALRAGGYRLFIETIRKNSRHGGALRIDHFMRFFRLYAIPEGFPASAGAYVRFPYEDLLGILALESVRGRFLVVGEDLGTVPAELRDAMERYGMLGYRLFFFEKDEHGAPKRAADYPRGALVSSTTHDLPTLAGFWAGRDIEVRRAAGRLRDDAMYVAQRAARQADKRRMVEMLLAEGLLPAGYPLSAADGPELSGELHNAIIGLLVSTPSALMLLNQEDLTKETEQQNLPGTTAEYPNWRRKMRYTLEELQTGAEPRAFAAMFRNWLERSGRLSAGRG